MKPENIDRRMILVGLGGAVAGSLLAARKARAGDLNPPAGPIAPQMHTMQELYDRIARTSAGVAEPSIPIESLPSSQTASRVISSSGSYFLTQNFQGDPDKNGIEVTADDVDIDLCGFNMYGAGRPGALVAAITSDRSNTCVYDGSLLGWTFGVNFGSATRWVLWDIACLNSIVGGFRVGSTGQAYDLEVFNAPGDAYQILHDRNQVEECTAVSCGFGFHCLGANNLLLSNSASDCTTPYEIVPGNAYGPIVNVAGMGDISLLPNTLHPGANYVF